MPIWDKWFGRKDDPSRVLARLENEFNGLYDQQQYVQSIELAERALELARLLHSPQDAVVAKWHQLLCKSFEAARDYASLLAGIAGLFRDLGNYNEAERVYQETLNTFKRVQAEEHPDYANTLNNLALLYKSIGDLVRVEPLHQEALAIRKRVLGEQHPDYAESLNNLGVLYRDQCDYGRAEPLYQEALAIRKRVLGEQHPDYAESLNNLGVLYHAIGDYERAEPLLEQASETYRIVLGTAHPTYVECVHCLAVLHRDMGNFGRAQLLYVEIQDIIKQVLGQEHPTYAVIIGASGVLHEYMGDYGRAELLYQEMHDIVKQALGQEHPTFALSLHKLAVLYQAMGDYQRAESLYQEALAIRKRVLGEQHPEYADTLKNLALLYRAMGNYQRAEPLVQEALGIYRQVFGEQHPEYADTLNSLAALYQAMGDYQRAESLVQEALGIYRQVFGEQHPVYAGILNNLAVLYHAMGDYQQAKPLYQEALTIRKRVFGEQHPNYAHSLNGIAVLYQVMGDYQRAESLYQEALAIRKRVLSEQHPDYAHSLNGIAVLYLAMGDYQRAEPLVQEALGIYRQVFGEQHPEYADTLKNLALLYRAMGDYQRAEPLVQEALGIYRQVFGEQHPEYAAMLHTLSVLYMLMWDYERAEALLEEARQIYQRVLGTAHMSYANALNTLSVLYQEMGNYQQAEPLLEEALTINRRVLGDTHSRCATPLNNLAALYRDLGDYVRAEPLLEEALDIIKQMEGEQHPNYVQCLQNLCALRISRGDPESALGLQTQALATTFQTIGMVFAIASDRQRIAYLLKLQSTFDVFLSLVMEFFPSSPLTLCLAFDTVLQRKGLATQALALQGQLVFAGKYPSVANTLHEWHALRAQIARKTLDGPGEPEHFVEHHRLLSQWTAEQEHLETVLAKAIPEIALTQNQRMVTVQAAADALPPGTVLVECVRYYPYNFGKVLVNGERKYYGRQRYAALILPAGQPDAVHRVDLGDAARIDDLIDRFRAELTGVWTSLHLDGVEDVATTPTHHRGALQKMLSPIADAMTRDVSGVEEYTDEEAARKVGHELRAVVWDPIVEHIGASQRVFISSDGNLTRLPFEILPVAHNEFLIDRYQMSYLSTGRDLIRVSVHSDRTPSPPLVVADPDFNLGATSEQPCLPFRRLRGTYDEGERVGGLLRTRPALGEESMKALIARHMPNENAPSIIHLATHGFFLSDQGEVAPTSRELYDDWGGQREGWDRLSAEHFTNPLLRSGLVFAGVNTWLGGDEPPPEAEDGLLTAEDVARLDLLETELVVLSACETGLGEVKTGEGVFGLGRAFMLAGAKTLVMSLWKVPDRATQELMVDFYERLLRGEGRAEALRQAQLMLKERYPHPRNWGAFICQGEPGPLPQHVLDGIRKRKADVG